MAKTTKEERIVREIIKTYGARLDLEKNPHTFLEIVRRYALDLSDGGSPPGGVGPVGPTGPTSLQIGPGIADLMKEVLKLQRQIAKISKQLDAQ